MSPTRTRAAGQVTGAWEAEAPGDPRAPQDPWGSGGARGAGAPPDEPGEPGDSAQASWPGIPTTSPQGSWSPDGGAGRTWTRRRLPRVGLTQRGWGLLALALLLAVAWYLLRLHLLMDTALLLLAPVATALLAVAVLAAVNLLRRPRPRVGVVGLPQVGERVLVSIRAGCLVPGFLPAWVVWQVGPGRGGLARTPLDAGNSALAVSAALRGPAEMEALGLEVVEPLGLACARLPLGAGLTMLVLPQPMPLPEPLARPRASLHSGGRVGETGEERVGSLRDYRPGDALASIHWKQSARLDRLVVTEQEHEARPQACLALVIGPSAYARPERFEAAVAMAAGVIEDWGRERYGTDLLLLTRAPDSAPGPEPGSGQAAPEAGRVGRAGQAGGADRAGRRAGEGWTALRYHCEEVQTPALIRVLALLEPSAPEGLEALRRRVAHHEPGPAAEILPLPGRLRADVVLTGPGRPPRGPAPATPATTPPVDRASAPGAGRTGPPADPAAGPSANLATAPAPSHPPLDPSARGTLVVARDTAGQAGAVPATWRVLEAPTRAWRQER